MNIYQRINKVREAVSYVQKDKQITGGGNYKAVSHDMVVAIVREHFVKNGIVTYPEQVMGKMNPQGQKASKDGNGTIPDHMRLYEGGYKIHFVNMDAPEDRVSVDIEAHAMDNGDKAPGKAVTYATKAAILKLLMLETGEDEESRTEHLRQISEEQLAELERIASEVGADMAGFCRFLKVASLDELPAKSFDAAKKALEAKRNQKAKAS